MSQETRCLRTHLLTCAVAVLTLGPYPGSCRGEWRGMFLPSDVILETVTYGGVVNAACHGVGQTQVRTGAPSLSEPPWVVMEVTLRPALQANRDGGVLDRCRGCGYT